MFENLGQRLQSRRKQLGWSLRRLGEECNVSASFLSDVENEKAAPSLEKLSDIAGALEVSVAWLLGEQENNENDEVLINNVKKGDVMYELLLSKHIFPNGLTYEQMCEKIELLEKLQKMLGGKDEK